jgi:DNA polymerase-4
VVPCDRELTFLHALPVERVWGVGAVTAEKLHRLGITTVDEIAALPEATLVAMLGRASGRQLHALSHNRDPRPVQERPRRRSMGAQRALGRSRRSADEIDTVLLGLVDRVMRRLRAAGRVGRTVVLRMRFDDFSRAARSHTLLQATDRTHVVLEASRGLLAEATPAIERQGLTLVGITVANLANAYPLQLSFPLDRLDRQALDTALDEIHDRYGATAVTRAALLGRDPGIVVPLLPD